MAMTKHHNGRLVLTMLALGLAIYLSAWLAVAVSGSSDVTQDPKGDVLSATESANKVAPGTPEDTARDYLDIKSVKVTKQNGGDRYVFSMTVAGPVPKDLGKEVCYGWEGPAGDRTTILVNPPNPGACFFAWNWDLDDTGSPFGVNQISPTVRWINGAFQGIAFLDGGAFTFDDFKVSGAHITATVDASEIESRVDVSDGFYVQGVTRNHRIDFGGDPVVGVADTSEMSHVSQ